MLEHFRSSYPTGCLISELITIHNGKYVVRALVLVNGETLATGLGSADTVEVAEDLARERSLATLTLHTPLCSPEASVEFSPSPPPTSEKPQFTKSVNTSSQIETDKLTTAGLNIDLNKVSDSEKPQFIKSVNTSSQIETDKLPTARLNINLNEVSDTPTISLASEKSEISNPLKKDKLPIAEYSINYNDVSDLPQDSSAFDNSWLNKDYSQEQKEEKIDETTEALIDSINHRESEIITSESKRTIKDLATSINSNNQIDSSDQSEDVSDDNVSIDILIDSLGWTKEQERDFIEQNYSQKTRQFLTPEELSNFNKYLYLLQKVTKEIKVQGWKAKQQKDYFEYNHNKELLEQLTIHELHDFWQYLEVFCKTTNEIKRLGWSSTKGKTFLKKTYGQEGRTRLSFEELQDFLQQLEALDTPE
ncbi:MAG: hypothetical protein MK289_03510 [Trichodesmium sp. ALOHA_ZT_67]|nr:hypothetical protein [Trichodesmium sp. ALOHA_ZT_67]